MRPVYYLLICSLLLTACRLTVPTAVGPPTSDQVPDWASQAIWYQIFVERFDNGDPTNDPQPVDMRYAVPDSIPSSWAVTPWGWDWYQPDPWFADLSDTSFYRAIQLRRYGGDLQGVLNRLDHLATLGITAIYFNPLNDAPSLHKYDPRYYHHIDRNFGPDPRGDAQLMARENHADPRQWVWTAADSLFLQVIAAAHRRGMRVIMDYSWNHTGYDFWALNDIRQRGAQSPYRDWYEIHQYDDPATAADELDFAGWFGIKYLPELRERSRPYTGCAYPEGTIHPIEGQLYDSSLRAHLLAVADRWLDPNADGNPADGVDGFRLDVAAEVPMGFWREWRQHVRKINPAAYLVGEVWYEKWPYDLLDPSPFLAGDQFDAVMNYRWYRLARGLFGQQPPRVGPRQFVAGWDSLQADIAPAVHYAMMNVAASHDSPRLATSLYNDNYYKYHASPNADSSYRVSRPDATTRRRQQLLLAHQFTFVGAPHIWNGDELGMWGADDPDCRKPIVWPDRRYRPESYAPPRQTRLNADPVTADTSLLHYYRQLVQLRRAHPVLATGKLEFLLADDARQCLVYRRFGETRDAVVAFNLSQQTQIISLPAITEKRHTLVWQFPVVEVPTKDQPASMLQLAPQSVQLWIENK